MRINLNMDKSICQKIYKSGNESNFTNVRCSNYMGQRQIRMSTAKKIKKIVFMLVSCGFAKKTVSI